MPSLFDICLSIETGQYGFNARPAVSEVCLHHFQRGCLPGSGKKVLIGRDWSWCDFSKICFLILNGYKARRIALGMSGTGRKPPQFSPLSQLLSYDKHEDFLRLFAETKWASFTLSSIWMTLTAASIPQSFNLQRKYSSYSLGLSYHGIWSPGSRCGMNTTA